MSPNRGRLSGDSRLAPPCVTGQRRGERIDPVCRGDQFPPKGKRGDCGDVRRGWFIFASENAIKKGRNQGAGSDEVDAKDILSLVISLGSAAVATVAVLLSRTALNSQRHMQKWIVNHDLIARSDAMIINNNDLLTLHGIDQQKVLRDGITIIELLYICENLSASSAMINVSNDKLVTLSDYRKNFLQSDKLQIAWTKYLRGKMFSTTPWSIAVDKYIAELQENKSNTSAQRNAY